MKVLLFFTFTLLVPFNSIAQENLVKTINGFQLHYIKNSKSAFDGRVAYDSIAILNENGQLLDSLIFRSFEGDEYLTTKSELQFEGDDHFQIVSLQEVYQEPKYSIDDYTYIKDYVSAVKNVDDPYQLIGLDKQLIATKFYRLSDHGKIEHFDDSKEEIIKGVYELASLNHLPQKQLRLLRNSVFAQHGYKFNSEDLNRHFSKYDWYQPKLTNVNDLLTETDKEIINYILKQEK